MSETGLPLWGNSFWSTWALDGGFAMNLIVSRTASEIGFPLCGGLACSYFSSWALEGGLAIFFKPSVKKSETGDTLWGNSFFSVWAKVAFFVWLELTITVLVVFVAWVLLIWALDGGLAIFFKPSVKKSATGLTLWGSSFFSY